MEPTKRTRRSFLSLGAIGLGGLGFLGSGAASGPSSHDLLSSVHPDTLPATVVRGDLITGNATPKWARLPMGVAGRVLRAVATEPDGPIDAAWVQNFLRVVRSLSADVTISATGDSQASITPVSGETTYIPNWLVEARGAANAQYIVEGAIHDDVHTVLETFRFRYDATGAGDIFGVTTSIWALSGAGTTPTNFHLNFTTVTLGGGSFTVKQRFAYGWSG